MSAQTLVFRLLKIQSQMSYLEFNCNPPMFKPLYCGTRMSLLKIQRKTLKTNLKVIPLQKTQQWKLTSSSCSGLGETIDINMGDHFDKQPINQVSDVEPTNLVASLIALVSKHNASDSLLNDFLNRDQTILERALYLPGLYKSS